MDWLNNNAPGLTVLLTLTAITGGGIGFLWKELRKNPSQQPKLKAVRPAMNSEQRKQREPVPFKDLPEEEKNRLRREWRTPLNG